MEEQADDEHTSNPEQKQTSYMQAVSYPSYIPKKGKSTNTAHTNCEFVPKVFGHGSIDHLKNIHTILAANSHPRL